MKSPSLQPAEPLDFTPPEVPVFDQPVTQEVMEWLLRSAAAAEPKRYVGWKFQEAVKAVRRLCEQVPELKVTFEMSDNFFEVQA